VAVTGAMGDGQRGWRTFGERTIHVDPYVWLGQVDVELPDGGRYWHDVVRLHRAAVMALVDERDRVLMLWRHHCDCGGEPARADGADGPQQHARGADLSAFDRRAATGDRRRAR
jgi:hypothetical protein